MPLDFDISKASQASQPTYPAPEKKKSVASENPSSSSHISKNSIEEEHTKFVAGEGIETLKKALKNYPEHGTIKAEVVNPVSYNRIVSAMNKALHDQQAANLQQLRVEEIMGNISLKIRKFLEQDFSGDPLGKDDVL